MAVPITNWRNMDRKILGQHLGEIKGWRGIDEWVINFSMDAGLKVGQSDSLPAQGRLGRSFCELQSSVIYEAGNYGVNKSANKNDCLFHSFLSCTSSTFRKLVDDKVRNVVASFFRRVWLWNMVRNNHIKLLHDDLDDLKGVGFLEESTGEALARYFNINILWTQNRDFNGAAPAATFINNDSDSTICIFGDSTHFQPVKLFYKNKNSPITAPPNFILKDFDGESWHLVCFPPDVPACAFTEGEIVTYEGKDYQIIERRFDHGGPPCSHLVLEGPLGNNGKANSKNRITIAVEDVRVKLTHGGRRSTKRIRRRKQRSTRRN